MIVARKEIMAVAQRAGRACHNAHSASSGISNRECGFVKRARAANAAPNSYLDSSTNRAASHISKVTIASLWPHTTVSNSKVGLRAITAVPVQHLTLEKTRFAQKDKQRHRKQDIGYYGRDFDK